VESGVADDLSSVRIDHYSHQPGAGCRIGTQLIEAIVPEPGVFEEERGKRLPKGVTCPINRARDQGFKNAVR
jgi:hypothetical protein